MKVIALSIIGASVLIAGAIALSGTNSNTSPNTAPIDNVSLSEGKQIVEIGVKGGYSPRLSVAKADISTILRMKTEATFDCSSALTIPSINYQKNLPPSGITEIELPPQKAGTTLQGMCSMGMYNFEIAFN